MPGLVRSRSWGQTKPTVGTQIDWGHPLSQGLEFCMVLNEHGGMPHDLVTGIRATTVASWAREGVDVTGTNLIEFPNTIIGAKFAKASGLTIVWRGIPDSNANYQAFANHHAGGGGANNPFDFRSGGNTLYAVRAGAAAFSSYKDPSRTIPTGIPMLLGYTVADNTHATVPTFYLNSVGLAGTSDGTAAGTVAVDETDTLRFGRRADGVTQLDGAIHSVYIWSRPLQPSEMAWLTVEPYAFLQPPGPRFLYAGFDFVEPPAPTGNLVTTGNLRLHARAP